MRQVQLQLGSFYNEIKALVPATDFFEEVKPEDRTKDRERIKRSHS